MPRADTAAAKASSEGSMCGSCSTSIHHRLEWTHALAARSDVLKTDQAEWAQMRAG